jgi:hypothetical protein
MSRSSPGGRSTRRPVSFIPAVHEERKRLDEALSPYEEAARLRAPLIIDAEVVHLSAGGVADFDALHSRTADEYALPWLSIFYSQVTMPAASRWWNARRNYGGLCNARDGIQYVEHTDGDGDKMFDAVCQRAVENVDQGQEPEGTGRDKDS